MYLIYNSKPDKYIRVWMERTDRANGTVDKKPTTWELLCLQGPKSCVLVVGLHSSPLALA